MTGRTTAQLAGRLRQTEAATLALLEDSASLGLVELTEHGWRLTVSAERRYGQAFRNLMPFTEERAA